MPSLSPLPPKQLVLAPYDAPGYYWKAAQSTGGKTLENVELVVRGGRAGIINDDVPGNGPITLRNLKIRMAAGQIAHSEWGMRLYFGDDEEQDNVIEDVEVIDESVPGGPSFMDEHAFYSNYGRGNIRALRFTAKNIPAQGWQMRHTKNRADPDWASERIVELGKFQFVECGQLRGAGRAGFSLSLKDAGPRSILLVRGIEIECTQQRAVVKDSSGQWRDSFGAVCIEYAQHVEIDDLYIRHRNPDRPLVQAFDSGRTGKKQAAIKTLIVRRGEVIGGDFAVRVGPGVQRIEIPPLRGNGKIPVWVWDDAKNAWTKKRSYPAADGFKYRA